MVEASIENFIKSNTDQYFLKTKEIINLITKNDDNYKVFVEVAFKKKELFKSLDKINID